MQKAREIKITRDEKEQGIKISRDRKDQGIKKVEGLKENKFRFRHEQSLRDKDN